MAWHGTAQTTATKYNELLECFMKCFGICQLNRIQIAIIPARKQVFIVQMKCARCNIIIITVIIIVEIEKCDRA